MLAKLKKYILGNWDIYSSQLNTLTVQLNMHAGQLKKYILANWDIYSSQNQKFVVRQQKHKNFCP